jgi:hypothetical protein
MTKINKIIIALFIILIIFGLITIFIILKNNPATNNVPGKITVQTPQGSVVVNDYTQNPLATTSDATIIAETSEFQILNYKIDNSFLITLLSAPLKTARTDAENAFLKDLNITQPEACELKTSVVTPNSVDTNYSGRELGMDFCPNAVALP